MVHVSIICNSDLTVLTLLDLSAWYVRRGTASSTVAFLSSGVPQGLVRGPILFVLNMADLLQLVNKMSTLSTSVR